MTFAIITVCGGFAGAYFTLFLFTYPVDSEARQAIKILVKKVKALEKK